MNELILWGNYVAKAIIAFVVPFVVLLADLATQWLGWSEDGVIDMTEWQALAVAIIGLFAVYKKSNGPKPG